MLSLSMAKKNDKLFLTRYEFVGLPGPLPARVLDRVVQPILWSIHVSGDDVRRRPARHHLVRGEGVHVVVRRVQYFGTCKSQRRSSEREDSEAVKRVKIKHLG